MGGSSGMVILWTVVIALLFYYVDSWLEVLGRALIMGALWFAVVQTKKHKTANQKAEVLREQLRREGLAKVEAHKQKQESYRNELVQASERSLQTFEALPNHLLNAEKWLDWAEHYFAERAFVPFWDSIEHAASHLGLFHGGVSSIARDLKRYGELSNLYEAKAPRFPIVLNSVKGMTAGNTTNVRMKAVVYQVQRDFQFASIYEQRKTNQILIAGFTNLGQALDGMGHRLSRSIDELGGRVSAMSSVMQEEFQTLGEQITEGSQQIVEGVNALHSTAMQSTSELRAIKKRHDRSLDALGNIQRHTKPTEL